MWKTCASTVMLFGCLTLCGCAALAGAPETEPVAAAAVEAEPDAHLIVIEEFGPLVYRIDPAHRARWDQVLELQDRLFHRQKRTVEEDDRHRLYNAADTDDDDVLSKTEIEDAFRKMKRDYERHLAHST